MDEYVVTVLMEGEKNPTELKNYGYNVEEVVDNIVQMPYVEYIYHVLRIKDEEVWNFDTEAEPLREIRRLIIAAGGDITLKINLEEDDNENILN